MALTTGLYRTVLAQQAVSLLAQNGVSTGLLWALVPSSVVNKKGRVRGVKIDPQVGANADVFAATRISASRFTYVGTPVGPSAEICSLRSDYPTPVLDVRTAPTGLTVTLGARAGSTGLFAQKTGTAQLPEPSFVLPEVIPSREEEWLTLAPSEGMVIYQDTAGIASDPRRFTLSILHDEIDTTPPAPMPPQPIPGTMITCLANGFPVNLAGALDGWLSYSDFWDLYYAVRSANAVVGLNQVAITRIPGSLPPRFDVLIDLAANGDWTLHFEFVSPINPYFSIDIGTTRWRWSEVEQTRGLRSICATFLSHHMSRLDSLVFTVSP